MENEKGKLRLFAENIPNIVAIAVAAVASYRLLLVPERATQNLETAFGAISVVLLMLCTNQLLNAFTSEDGSSALGKVGNHCNTVEAALRMLTSRSDHLIGALETSGRLVKSPTNDPQIYVDLFGSFSGSFYAYNPAYIIEAGLGLNSSEAVLIKQVFVPRYKVLNNCTAHYLFFTGDESGRKSLSRFKVLMSKVATSGGSNVRKNLYVKEIESKHAATHDEIYFGDQHGHSTVVHELSAPAETYGQPSFYYVSQSSELKSVCEKQFNSLWEAGDARWVYNPDEQTPGFFLPS